MEDIRSRENTVLLDSGYQFEPCFAPKGWAHQVFVSAGSCQGFASSNMLNCF